MAQGSERVRLRAPDFGVGRRREAAALAKFAAKSGLGERGRLFVFFVAIPNDSRARFPCP